MRPSTQTILRGAFLGTATAVALGLHSDPDLWGHLRFGLDVLDTFTVPSVDIYSFTGDRALMNHEWLFDVFVAAIYRGVGPVGLSLVTGLVALASIAVARHIARHAGSTGWRLDALTVAVFLLGIAPLLQTFRAQVVSTLAFLILLACIRAFDQGKPRSLWVLPPLFLLWANVHGGWVMGAAILAIWAFTRFLASPGLPASRALMGACLAAAAVTFVNPVGTHLWAFLLETVRLERTDIREWHSVATSAPMLAVWGATTAVLAAAAWRAPRGTRVYLALAAFTALSSFRVMRLLPFHCMTVLLLVAPRLLAPPDGTLQADAESPWTPRQWVTATVVWAIVVAGAVGAGEKVGCLQPAGAFSVDGRAGQFLRDNRVQGRLVVYFDWGEYVVWHLGPGLRVSIDGRREVAYSPRTIARHQSFYEAAPEARAYLDELAPDLVWLPRKVAVSRVIGSWGWHPVFESAESAIWSRDPDDRAWRQAQQDEPSRCFPGP